MKLHPECVSCVMETRLERLGKDICPEKRFEFVRRMCEVVLKTDPEVDSAPVLTAEMVRLQREMFHTEDDYTNEKKAFNDLVLGILPDVRERIRCSADPLKTAVQLAICGNYIDFSVVKDVSPEKMLELVDHATETYTEMDEIDALKMDLEKGGEVIYLHDNCGEIALDMLLIETIQRLYPQVHVVSMVRSQPIQNDATIDDVRYVGLDKIAEIIDNGCDDLCGTDPARLPPALLDRLKNARVILSKGQGNLETLIGCGMNVYYLLLAKCKWYTPWFGLKQFSGVFANDRRIHPAK